MGDVVDGEGKRKFLSIVPFRVCFSPPVVGLLGPSFCFPLSEVAAPTSTSSASSGTDGSPDAALVGDWLRNVDAEASACVLRCGGIEARLLGAEVGLLADDSFVGDRWRLTCDMD